MARQHVDAADEHRRHREQRHEASRGQVAGQDQRDADDADRGRGSVQEPTTAPGDAGLDQQHGVESAVDHGRRVGVAPQDVRPAQRRTQVVTGGDALLGGGGVVGPGRLPR
ncbi:hypothetical protein [Nocardioides sp. B-3]|uniref:hypothetical protein n=1 Tax=Nocardioides sp. B-3 TaxID=2895565 RepID=UPI002152BF78|nr:hypothetical protein [Nocardioides sp. B-3]UUZ58727.1 hypothetical protein LP418_21845 [Nocardioides sp. B-3]